MHADRNMQWLLRHEKKNGKTYYWVLSTLRKSNFKLEIYLFYDEEADYAEEEAPQQQNQPGPGSPKKAPRIPKNDVPPV